jgi:acetyl esterase/lipase/CubicO group peptidase (beta-lactamase class C family)
MFHRSPRPLAVRIALRQAACLLRRLSAAYLLAWCLSETALAEMAFPGATWETASPESQGVDSAGLQAAIEYLKSHTPRDGVDKLVIVRHGRVIWAGPKADEQQKIWSATKSFTSTVLGLLIAQGRCTLDTRAVEFIPELDDAHPEYGQITLRHLATMTSGYNAVGGNYDDEKVDGSDTPLSPGEPYFAPGSKYRYFDDAMRMFGHCLTRIAGEPLEDYFRKHVAEPIGLKDWDWKDFGPTNGIVVNQVEGGMHITAREAARFGLLILNQGSWNGQSLVPAEWLTQAATVQVPADLPFEGRADGRGVYGFNWWLNGIKPDGTRKWPGGTPRTHAARGHNNNEIIVVPELHIVVTRLGLDEGGSGFKISDDHWGGFLARLGQACITDDVPVAAAAWSDLFESRESGELEHTGLLGDDGFTIEGGTAQYRVENGVIIGRTNEGSPNTFLCTDRDYANFELVFETRCDPDLNSGVQIRSHVYAADTPQESQLGRIRKQGEVYGYQCEVAEARLGVSGNFWDEGRRTRWLDDFSERPEARSAFRAGEWNEYRILAVGDHIRSWVNGVPCADFRDDRDASGFIGLQVHGIRPGTGPFEVRWRNLRVREFSIKPGINDSFADPNVGEFVERFEREGREVYDHRERVIASCGIQPGMAVADVGCGTGLFTRLFSKAVGPDGQVFAVDIAQNFVQHVESSCREQGMTNVQGVVCKPDSVNLPPQSIDLAFICDTYHHFEFPARTMRSIRRSLKSGGRVVLVDFEREEGTSSEWVLSHVRAGKATFTREIEQAGFRRLSEDDFLHENYLLVFEKAPSPEPTTSSTTRSAQMITDITYHAGSAARQLDLFLPPPGNDSLRPAIVFVHGGGWRQGDKGEGLFRSLPEQYAGQGYVCISVNYRLAQEAAFPACLEDVKCAVRWLRAHAGDYNVDPDRIGAFGISAGAHLVALLGLVGPEAGLEGSGPHADQASAVQAVCAVATPTDFTHWELRDSFDRAIRPLLAGPDETFARRAAQASPLTHVRKEAPPFLVIHGTTDDVVHIDQADRFVEALKHAGASDVTVLRVEGAGHGVFNQHRDQTSPATESFFRRTLRDH